VASRRLYNIDRAVLSMEPRLSNRGIILGNFLLVVAWIRVPVDFALHCSRDAADPRISRVAKGKVTRMTSSERSPGGQFLVGRVQPADANWRGIFDANAALRSRGASSPPPWLITQSPAGQTLRRQVAPARRFVAQATLAAFAPRLRKLAPALRLLGVSRLCAGGEAGDHGGASPSGPSSGPSLATLALVNCHRCPTRSRSPLTMTGICLSCAWTATL
jgi:hypothetical protein